MKKDVKTLDGHTAKFIAAVIENLPRNIDENVMQGWIENPKSLKKALNQALCPPMDLVQENSILKLLSGAETLMLDALDGKETLANAEEVFPLGIDSDFKNWGTNKAGIATKEQAADVYELVKGATFAQMFGSLGADLDKLCFTQAQIKNFCKKHSNWLRKDGHATFFLFKVEDQFFVARVYVSSGGLHVDVDRFGGDDVWGAERSRRMVVPQQKPVYRSNALNA